ncbi:hypothetical protein B296_00015178 [Ensete ventricosum]|uniref:Uncharacterized protein n=1 Tax=Ensete ventricosum TaxID=4639 RepID=A0A427A2A2_ENSVE|nr:hypothetical protein B296_00015178 [Ensete ventricosum]
MMLQGCRVYNFQRRKPLQGGSPAWPQPAPLQGWLATYKGGRSDVAKAPLQGGGRLRPGPLQWAATRNGGSPTGTNGFGQVARAYCKGQPPMARPQVTTTHYKAARGSPAARVVACKGDRWQEQSPAHEVPPEGSNACRRGGCHADGMQHRHLRRAVVAVATQIGARRGLGHPFK